MEQDDRAFLGLTPLAEKEIIERLAVEVEKTGGKREHLLRILTQEHLASRLAEHIVPSPRPQLTALGETIYRFPVYHRPFEELLAQAELIILSPYLKKLHLSCPIGQAVEVEGVLMQVFHTDIEGSVSVLSASNEFRLRKLFPAKAEHLVALIAKYPELSTLTIVALGTRLNHPSGGTHVLTVQDGYLNTQWECNNFSKHAYFLGLMNIYA